MPHSQALFEIVPVGEENAVSGRLLWKQLGMWSAESIKHNASWPLAISRRTARALSSSPGVSIPACITQVLAFLRPPAPANVKINLKG